MSAPRIINFWRPAHEAGACVGWAIAFLYCLGSLIFSSMSRQVFAYMLVLCALMLAMRFLQAHKLWKFKLALSGKATQTMPVAVLKAAQERLDGNLWLGWGFRWGPKHAQLANDVMQRDMGDVYPPKWLLDLLKVSDPREAKGLPWVHGLDKEKDIVIPFKALEGHTAVMAITGAMKTVLARLLVYQLAARGDAVFILDPKGDLELKQIAKEVTEALGKPEKFVTFHPAFSQQSFRMDAFSSWDRETQIASRIRLIMSADEDDNFVSFVWMTITNIVGCMKRIGKRVSIVTLLDCVQTQSTSERLAEKVLDGFLSEVQPYYNQIVQAHLKAAEGETKRSSRSQIVNSRLAAMVEIFKSKVPESQRPREVSGLISALESNREWFSKMIISLTPILTKLSAGDLGELLSPDYTNVDDDRPIFNTRKLVEGGYVAYFGLDALSDPSVAESIAAVTLADAAGTAGEIYNYDDPGKTQKRRVHIIGDEWGDLVCEPIIQLANKGRGAGVVLYLLGQTFSDLVDKLGDVHKAKRLLGNMNNIIVGATSDGDTLDMIARKFGETLVKEVGTTHSHGQKTEDTGLEYSANSGATVRPGRVDLVAGNILMGLPDLQFFAMVNRAQLFKGRIPVLTLNGAEI